MNRVREMPMRPTIQVKRGYSIADDAKYWREYAEELEFAISNCDSLCPARSKLRR